MRELLAEFRDAGGDGIEVLSPSHTRGAGARIRRATRGASASRPRRARTIHGPGESSVDLGDMPALPAGVMPVWQDW